MSLNDYSIRTKILFSMSLVLLLMVIVSTTVFISIIGLENTTAWVQHTEEAIGNGNRLEKEMINMETGMRGFLVAGKDTFLEPYVQGEKNFKAIMVATQQLVSDNPAQVSRLKKIDDLSREWIEHAAEAQIALRRKVNQGFGTVQAFKEIQSRIVGKEIFDKLREALNRTDKKFTAEGNQAGKNLIQTITLDLVNMETGQRGFLLTGQEASLEPFKNGQASFQSNLNRLYKLVASSRNARVTNRDIDEIRKLVNSWLKNAAEPEINARYQVNKIPATIDDLIALIEKGEGKKYMDDIRLRIKEFIDVEKNLKTIRQKEAEHSSLITKLVVIMGTILAMVLGFATAFFIARKIADPMADLVEILNLMAKGIVEKTATVSGKDEIAKLGESFNKMVGNLKSQVDLTSTIADGDLSKNVSLASEKDLLGKALDKMMQILNETVTRLKNTADGLNSSAEQLSASSQSLSQDATEQAASLEEITSSMTELGVQTKTNAENAGQASRLAAEVRETGQKGTDQMTEMNKAMEAINGSSKEISKIIKVIDEIAFQTNLLALNAAVEAARAGTYGKGFAVVAEEVRNLASRSAMAARETSDLIESAVTNANEGTIISEKTAEALQSINEGVTKVTDLVDEIANSSNEQAQGIDQVNKGLSQIDSVTQRNAAGAEETSSAAQEVLSKANQVHGLLTKFKLKEQVTATEIIDKTATDKPEQGQAPKLRSADIKTPTSPKTIVLDAQDFGKY